MKKIIGVMPLWDEKKDSLWMLPGYMEMLEYAGALPLMLPLTADREELDDCLTLCGGFLFTGGHDVSPEVYHAKKSPACGNCCPKRDEMEQYVLNRAIEADRSVLGICRGIQFMNAACGGTLYQDIPTEYADSVDHHMTPPYDRHVHRVCILPDTLLGQILGEGEIGVNSYHHQAVRRLAPCFRSAAISEDGLIEGIYMPDRRFIAAVQWHPEFSWRSDENSRKLVQAFVDSVR